MLNDAVDFFSTLRSIFGVCPCCNQLFRLSDCRIYVKKRPRKDWMDKLEECDTGLYDLQRAIDQSEREMRREASKKGRRDARRLIRKLDPVFAPLHLDADDAKVLCHPIDYVVFDGMNTGDEIATSIVLLDRYRSDARKRRVQRSIEKAIEQEHYDWITLRVRDDGSIQEE